MPLAATCSGALNAACHPANSSLWHHEQEVHWGVELGDNVADSTEGTKKDVDRCTFTSLAATYPTDGRLYA